MPSTKTSERSRCQQPCQPGGQASFLKALLIFKKKVLPSLETSVTRLARALLVSSCVFSPKPGSKSLGCFIGITFESCSTIAVKNVSTRIKQYVSAREPPPLEGLSEPSTDPLSTGSAGFMSTPLPGEPSKS